eukprot:TRINITY_DN1804_c0_g1_i15.p1 TRINITY_DN1804_c0_g1~~TRINITY_DN1804_c0_g1_i15.p1  ORF type:complete len:263 (+),score=73.17 TRINITY_DN1804_c0_g1_i15:469-1257(+)
MHARHALLFGVLCVLYAAACAQTTTNTTGSDESDIGANETGPNEHMMISHGWLMCISAMVLVPAGIISQRFFNELFGFDKRRILILHISVFIIAMILETVGIALGAAYTTGSEGFAGHKRMGYLAYVMLLVSNLLGAIRAHNHPLPDVPEEAPQASGCTLHRVVGMLTLLFGAYGVFSGKGTLSDLGHGEVADIITYFGIALHSLLWPFVIWCWVTQAYRRRKARETAHLINESNPPSSINGEDLEGGAKRQPTVTSPLVPH